MSIAGPKRWFSCLQSTIVYSTYLWSPERIQLTLFFRFCKGKTAKWGKKGATARASPLFNATLLESAALLKKVSIVRVQLFLYDILKSDVYQDGIYDWSVWKTSLEAYAVVQILPLWNSGAILSSWRSRHCIPSPIRSTYDYASADFYKYAQKDQNIGILTWLKNLLIKTI